LPAHNARFAVAAEHPGSAFVADRAGAWRDILSAHETRILKPLGAPAPWIRG